MNEMQRAAIAEFKNELRDMDDAEIRREISHTQGVIDEETPWVEALVSEQIRRAGSPEQQGVADWASRCIGEVKLMDKKERAFRFLEEALELVQACEVTPTEVDVLRDYVFGRPVGELDQEIGGTIVCLMALGTANGIDVLEALYTEMERVNTPEMMAKIRAKALAAPEGPLPQ